MRYESNQIAFQFINNSDVISRHSEAREKRISILLWHSDNIESFVDQITRKQKKFE